LALSPASLKAWTTAMRIVLRNPKIGALKKTAEMPL
jgi:hypothetical protein